MQNSECRIQKTILHSRCLHSEFNIQNYTDVAVARPAGFEPAAFGSGGQRSIQLSYGRFARSRSNVKSGVERTDLTFDF